MPLGCQSRVAGVYVASLTGFCCLLLLYCELIHHYLVLAQCSWPAALPEPADPGLRVMVISDPHLLGSRHGHWFDKLRREWQMHRSYVSAVSLHRPQLVLFLGDLYDEGKWSGPSEFRETAARFDRLFPVSDELQRLVVAGNHDIGFHYSARGSLWRRFDAVHNTSGVSLVSVSERLHLVLVNSVAMERDGCQLCAAAEKQLDTVTETLRCSQTPGGAGCDGVRRIAYSRPVLVQHYPLYRPSDSHCRGPDAAPVSQRSAPFRPGWECLSEPSSAALLTQLRPRLVLSGHTHDYCRTEHRLAAADGQDGEEGHPAAAEGETVTEYSVPSFSWRNRHNPSFLMVRLSADQHSVLKCWMADERTVLALYLVGGPAALVLSFVVTARRRVIRRWNGPDARPTDHMVRSGKQE